MIKQKGMSQMKGQDKIQEKQLNEVEIGNIPEKQFRMIVKLIQNLRKKMETKIEKMQERLTKGLEELKNKQTEINNTLEGINSKITEAEERIKDLEDRKVEITTAEQKIEKRMKRNEDSLRDLWDNIKHTNIHIIGVPEREEREKGPEKIFEEIISEYFPNTGKKIVKQVQEAQSPRNEKPKEEHTETHSTQTE